MPEKIGKYQILERIGGGGMGVIFKAHDTVLDRLVALKFISSEAAVTDELRARFFREAQACARLSHPNIVTVHDLGEDNGRFFIVMELLEGEELRRLIAQRTELALEDKLAIMMQVCDGLAFAHQKGIVHRDIKPANIFVLRTGQVKILDFGVAHIATADRGLTRTGLIMGTLRYIAPEQVQGRADHRSDIFSLGAVFYELLSLRPPFTGEDAFQLLEQLRTQDPPPLGQVAPAVPPELAAIVERAMRKDPGERFANLDQMRDRLEQVLQTIGEEAQRVRGRVRRQRDDLRALQASLAERIGASPDEEAVPPFDERGRLATMQRLEADLAARIEAVQTKIARAAALAPALQRGAEALEAGQFARAVTELEAIVAEMPDHARAQEALGRARARAEEEQRRQRLVDTLVQDARAALEHGGFALCLELLNQVAESLPADARRVIAPLREQAEVGLATQEALRRTRQQAEQALEQMTGARRSAQAWAASQYATALWNDAEARSSEAQGAFARQAYAEASRDFEEATALYRRSEEFVRDAARARGIERGATPADARTLAGGEQAGPPVPREDTMSSVPVVQPPPVAALSEAPEDRAEPAMLGDTRIDITDATRISAGGPPEEGDVTVAARGDTAQVTVPLGRRLADASGRQALWRKLPGGRVLVLAAGGLAAGLLALSYWLLQVGPPASSRGPDVTPAAHGTLAQAPSVPGRVGGPEPQEERPQPAPAAGAGQEARTQVGSLSKGNDDAEMVLVPAGEFWMGSTPAEVERVKAECRTAGNSDQLCKERFDPELPRHRVVLDAFYIDRFEVTNHLFERFVRKTGYLTTAQRLGSGAVYQHLDGKWKFVKVDGAEWRAPKGPGSSIEANHPVVQVSWLDAGAYCRWAGKRLPTEAEWEKAARGPESRRYPWGDSWDRSKANGWETAAWTTKPVGSYPNGVSPYGIHDMAGNVIEWLADWHDATYYERSPERNPRGSDVSSKRALRGGSWINGPSYLRSAWRPRPSPPDDRSDVLGFRCAKGAEQS